MNNTVEREISLENLFWKLLLGWRRWLILGIVFAALVSGLKYKRDISAYQAAVAQQGKEEEKEEKDIILEPEEREAVENAKEIMRQMDEVEDYLKESMLMNLDPYQENMLTLQFYVNTNYTYNYTQDNERDRTGDVVSAYCSYARTGKLAEAVVDALNEVNGELQANYVGELISASEGSSMFLIYVLYPDAEAFEQIQKAVTQALESRTAEITEKIGSHTLELISAQESVRTDTDLARRQKDQMDILEGYRSRLTAAKGAMTEAQLEALQIKGAKDQREKDKDEEEEEGEEPIVLIEPSYSVKYLILGIVVGIFLACVWVVLEVLFSGKIQEPEEISSLYGVRILGEMTEERKKKRFLSVVDNWILKLKNRNKKQLSPQQQLQIVCSNLEIACKKDGMEQIYLTGSEIEKMDEKRISDMKAALKSAGITVLTGENVVYDASALMKMAKIGQVVFLEQIGASLYQEVEKEVRLSRENEVKVIGSIVVNEA